MYFLCWHLISKTQVETRNNYIHRPVHPKATSQEAPGQTEPRPASGGNPTSVQETAEHSVLKGRPQSEVQTNFILQHDNMLRMRGAGVAVKESSYTVVTNF